MLVIGATPGEKLGNRFERRATKQPTHSHQAGEGIGFEELGDENRKASVTLAASPRRRRH
jgi:hypothetical protein